MHFFQSSLEALAAPGIHRQKSKCLREAHTIRTFMQKLDVGIYLAKDRPKDDFPERSLRDGAFCK